MNSAENPRADTPSDAGGLASLTAIYLQQTTSLSNALIDMWSAWVQAADVVSRERGLAVGNNLTLIQAGQDRDALMNFHRMEKWLTDRPDHPGAATQQWLKELYQDNKLFRGELAIDGRLVDLGAVVMPVLNIYSETDTIIHPLASKLELAAKTIRSCRYQEGTLVSWLRARRSWVTALPLGWRNIDQRRCAHGVRLCPFLPILSALTPPVCRRLNFGRDRIVVPLSARVKRSKNRIWD